MTETVYFSRQQSTHRVGSRHAGGLVLAGSGIFLSLTPFSGKLLPRTSVTCFEQLLIASPNMGQSHSTPSLLGTWRLVSFEARDSKGQLQYPLGERVSGLLMYDAGGNMSAHVLRNDLPRFADPDRGTDAEIRAAFEGYASYFGTYTIDEATQTVTHHVRGAWYPNWIGNDQLRHFKFDDSHLVLSTPSLVSGGESLEYVLTWERVS